MLQQILNHFPAAKLLVFIVFSVSASAAAASMSESCDDTEFQCGALTDRFASDVDDRPGSSAKSSLDPAAASADSRRHRVSIATTADVAAAAAVSGLRLSQVMNVSRASVRCADARFICDTEADCADGSDEDMCSREMFRDNFLIVADHLGRNIYQFRLSGSPEYAHPAMTSSTWPRLFRLLPPNTNRRPMALAYDVTNDVIFWTDSESRRILKRPLGVANATTSTVFAGSAEAKLTGLAVDSARQVLYYADEREDGGRVGRLATVGGQHHVLLTSTVESASADVTVNIKPCALALDCTNSILYWADCGRPSSINRLFLLAEPRSPAARQSQTLVTDNLASPNALALDQLAGLLYWADGELGRVERCHVSSSGSAASGGGVDDGGGERGDRCADRQLIYSRPGDMFNSITLDHRHVYLTDRNSRSIRILDRVTHQMTDQPAGLSGYLAGIIAHTDANVTSSTDRQKMNETIERQSENNGTAAVKTAVIILGCEFVLTIVTFTVLCTCRKRIKKLGKPLATGRRRRRHDNRHRGNVEASSLRTLAADRALLPPAGEIHLLDRDGYYSVIDDVLRGSGHQLAREAAAVASCSTFTSSRRTESSKVSDGKLALPSDYLTLPDPPSWISTPMTSSASGSDDYLLPVGERRCGVATGCRWEVNPCYIGLPVSATPQDGRRYLTLKTDDNLYETI